MFFKKLRSHWNCPFTKQTMLSGTSNIHMFLQEVLFLMKRQSEQVCCLPKTINIPVFKIFSSIIFTRHAQLSHMYSSLTKINDHQNWRDNVFISLQRKESKVRIIWSWVHRTWRVEKMLSSLSYHTVTLLLLSVCLELVALLAIWLLFAAEFTLNDKTKFCFCLFNSFLWWNVWCQKVRFQRFLRDEVFSSTWFHFGFEVFCSCCLKV